MSEMKQLAVTAVQAEADKLRNEARERLHALLCSMGKNDRAEAERIVDCIVGAAVLEGAALQSAAIRASK